MSDDRARFLRMMEAKGWEYEFEGDAFFKGQAKYLSDGRYYVGPKEWYQLDEKEIKQIGDWRAWLEAGQTPPPW